jgi:hypothetical protein
MSITVNPRSATASGAGSASLMYAPPPSTLVASPYTTSLFAPAATSQARHQGHTKARSHVAHPHIPHFSHRRAQLPPGVEEQPF